jgi:hypothetical protein
MATRIIHDGPVELTDVLAQAQSLLPVLGKNLHPSARNQPRL